MNEWETDLRPESRFLYGIVVPNELSRLYSDYFRSRKDNLGL